MECFCVKVYIVVAIHTATAAVPHQAGSSCAGGARREPRRALAWIARLAARILSHIATAQTEPQKNTNKHNAQYNIEAPLLLYCACWVVHASVACMLLTLAGV